MATYFRCRALFATLSVQASRVLPGFPLPFPPRFPLPPKIDGYLLLHVLDGPLGQEHGNVLQFGVHSGPVHRLEKIAGALPEQDICLPLRLEVEDSSENLFLLVDK